MLTSLTIQEAFLKNIESGTQAGVTFIEGEGNTEYMPYKKLYIEARYALFNLQQQGLKPGDELVFQFMSNKNFLITFWACIFGKITPVPLVFGVTSDIINKISNVWQRLSNPYLITDLPTLSKVWKESFPDKTATHIDIDSRFLLFEAGAYTRQAQVLPSEPADLAFVQFSSGSTGHPKGVKNTHEGIIYNINTMSYLIDIRSSDKFLGWMPLTHDLGLVFFHLLPLLQNVPQFLVPPMVFFSSPNVWLKSLAVHGITVSGSPNFGYRHSMEHFKAEEFRGLSFSSMRLMINGAEMVSVRHCRQFEEMLAPYGFAKRTLVPAYGLAEAVLGVAVFQACENRSRVLFVNRNKMKTGDAIEFVEADDHAAAPFADTGPYTGTEVKITNDALETLPENTLGIIHLRSKAVTKGFYNDAENTKKTVSEDGWLNTGDLGFITDKHLVITGRSKEMILINGQNYFPADIDAIIEELPEIQFQQAISCNTFNSEKYQDEIVVFLLYKGTVQKFTALENMIKLHVADRTGLVIKKVVAVERIPRTTSGKIQRYILLEEFTKGRYAGFMNQLELEGALLKTAARSLTKAQIEENILQLVQDLFNITGITVASSFFAMGLSSLQIAQLKINIESFLYEELEDISLFRYSNVQQLSEHIYTDILKNEATGVAEPQHTVLNTDRIKRFAKTS